VTWRAPERTRDALAVYAAAEADREARPERYALGDEAVDGVVARATGEAGERALGDADDWRPGLAAYLRSAGEDGRLNALGARTALGTAVSKLRARIAIAEHLAAHPDHDGAAVAPPIVITGGWRTGTTFLFRLLATDPRLRAPLPAERTAPGRFGGLGPRVRAARLDAAASAHDGLHLLNPPLASVHDSGARLPEECVLAMGSDLRSWGFSSTMRLEGYSAWLAGEDLAGTYRRHREMLGMLDEGDGRRWVLKAPAHTAELEHIARTYPGAVVVQLHRDIVETVASGASLFATFRSTYSDEVDGADVGRFQADQTELWLRRAVAFRSSPASAGVTVVDIAYRDLVDDPVAVVSQIWTAAELEPLPDPDGFVDAHRTAQPRHAKGVHRYEPADFGLVPDELYERFAFAEPASGG
jgi:hypothetical protein